MDLIKTLLVYMVMVVSGATEASPALTPPPPQAQPSETPALVETAAPSQAPTLAPTLLPTFSAVPTVTPTPAPYTTLQVGDRGEDVKKLQRRLAELGYLNDKIDGIFGQNTKKAVERFQYYNNLTQDGKAGKATLTKLYESTSVVTAPPNITPNPTVTLQPAVAVQVYYVDQSGLLLYQMAVNCYGTTTIYANNAFVGSEYALISSGAVTVNIRRGVATPSSVTFRYQRVTTPVPSYANLPVVYETRDGQLIYSGYVQVPFNAVTPVYADASRIPEGYALFSESPVNVSVNLNGMCTPASVTFLLAARETAAPTGTVTPTPTPEVTPTTAPTDAPTQVPTAEPSEAPTTAPTAEPSEAPTEAPTDVPTAEPSAEPSEAPTTAPTEEPTQAPTEEPTPTPTPEPLTQAGGVVAFNNDVRTLPWYRDASDTPFISLQQMATVANWNYKDGAGVILGHAVSASKDRLTVDEKLLPAAYSIFWNNDLYVSDAFLKELGCAVAVQGTELHLTFESPN
ncbi:MAG: peptidoglycan-binding protein [Eubacteriales bacterium]|nr:peptidoglycan-binding protein [Eubacteriales bacterium]